MAFDLTDDQLALRDGIGALVTGRFPIEAVRQGFDRAGFDELAAAGVFSLRDDGFTWADAVLVYEELGRGLVPGPLVSSFGAESAVLLDMVATVDPATPVIFLDTGKLFEETQDYRRELTALLSR